MTSFYGLACGKNESIFAFLNIISVTLVRINNRSINLYERFVKRKVRKTSNVNKKRK